MKRTTVYLEESVDLALAKLAKQRQQPKAELLREALSGFIAQQEVLGVEEMPSWVGGGDSSAGRDAQTGGSSFEEHLTREYEEILESYARAKAQT